MAQSKDPVCGMSVDSHNTKHKTEHQGEQHVFCSEQCLAKFKKNPAQYTNKTKTHAR